ncbi:hypothetical protein APHAL10511_000876 [Amanita phalloides]|nr:hypothetical protein APHAL10511_000876 [Amanita phalloides]
MHPFPTNCPLDKDVSIDDQSNPDEILAHHEPPPPPLVHHHSFQNPIEELFNNELIDTCLSYPVTLTSDLDQPYPTETIGGRARGDTSAPGCKVIASSTDSLEKSC